MHPALLRCQNVILAKITLIKILIYQKVTETFSKYLRLINTHVKQYTYKFR